MKFNIVYNDDEFAKLFYKKCNSVPELRRQKIKKIRPYYEKKTSQQIINFVKAKTH